MYKRQPAFFASSGVAVKPSSLIPDEDPWPGPPEEARFTVVYHFYSMQYKHRLRLVVPLQEAEAEVSSLTSLWGGANWLEREVWDMFGVFFTDHPDLRRLLTDYGFEGHPLRKDFPLTGFVETRYDEERKRVVYDPVKLSQEFRKFDFLSPWEGASNTPLPGDEKAEG